METEYKAPVRFEQSKVLIAYLSGKTIEYFDGYQWATVFPYKYPNDITRLTNKKYKFRIKSEK